MALSAAAHSSASESTQALVDLNWIAALGAGMPVDRRCSPLYA